MHIKKVFCYSPEGEYIAEYKSARDLDKLYNLHPDSFRKHIDTNRVYKNHIWSYEKKDDYFDFTQIKPKILIFDIETAPLHGLFWRVWKENISPNQLLDDWFMLSWVAKWLGDINLQYDILTSQEAMDKNDKRIISHLWDMIDQADIIIAHNAKKFDKPKLNSRCLKYDMPPPSPYRIIDTLITAKKQFGQTYNSLNELARFLGFDLKMDTDFSLWEKSINGEKESLNEMLEYNKGDVEILEDIYLRLRPWMNSHPNVALYYPDDEERCHRCGSKFIQWTKDFYYTPTGKYQVYQCENCHGYGRARHMALSKTKKESLNAPIAR